MKVAVIYASTHHENTKKLVDAIAEGRNIDVINAVKQKEYDLSDYDLIGFASGVAYGKYYPQILSFMETNLPKGKKVFFIHIGGSPKEKQNSAAKLISDQKQCKCLGTYCCKGFDTYGPFKLIGGMGKGHPNNDEIAASVSFFERISAAAEN